jgi:hypothetical protein
MGTKLRLGSIKIKSRWMKTFLRERYDERLINDGAFSARVSNAEKRVAINLELPRNLFSTLVVHIEK